VTDKRGDHRIISRRIQFVQIDRNGEMTQGGHAPYLDYRPASEDEGELIKDILNEQWLQKDLEAQIVAYSAGNIVPDHLKEVKNRREKIVDLTLQAVHDRLIREINFWSTRAIKLQEEVSAGRQPQVQPEMARRRAEDLTARLKERQAELKAQRHVVSSTPIVIGGALIIPQGFLDQQSGEAPQWAIDPEARAKVEKLAMKAVTDKEEALGNMVEDVSAAHCGWDITSKTTTGDLQFIEVKGRVKGASTITVTKNEIFTCLNQPEKFILAIVLVDEDEIEGPYYVHKPFSQEPDFGVTSVNYSLSDLLDQGSFKIKGS